MFIRILPIQYEIYGHSGEDSEISFTRYDKVPKNNNERLKVLKVRLIRCNSSALQKQRSIDDRVLQTSKCSIPVCRIEYTVFSYNYILRAEETAVSIIRTFF